MKKTLPAKSLVIEPIVHQMKNIINTHYGNRLKYVILYGSYARGTFTRESDIDIMVVLNDMPSAYAEIDVLTDLKTDLMLDNEIFISTNPTSTQQFENDNQLFYRNVRKEGILL